MKTYEITFITKEDLKEKPVKKLIDDLGGKILATSSLGEKTFTYPIKKEEKGVYTTVTFEIEPEKLLDLNKKLSLEEEILRHLIIIHKAASVYMPKPKEMKAEKVVAPELEIAAPKEEKELPAPKEMKKIEKPAKKVEKKVVKPKAEKVMHVPTKAEEIERETISEEDRLKELDKKLDELLKE